MSQQKIIFVTGGVMSGLGKGTAAASIGKLFQFRGKSVSMIKIDPYLNIDAGTMSPFEHGENFVCEDIWKFEPVEGKEYRIAEIDQDFGTYERFIGHSIHPSHNITGGQIWLTITLKERKGEYLGETVQIIPHVTEEIKGRIRQVVREGRDVTIVEVGGTVGDIEASIFLEAIREMRNEFPKEDTLLVHVSYIPYLPTVEQQKTKPTQHSYQNLLEAGLVPDIVVGRARRDLSKETISKLSLYGGIPKKAVISNPNIEIIYELPLIFEKQNLGKFMMERLKFEPEGNPEKKTRKWKEMVEMYKTQEEEVKIAMVSKYTRIKDSHVSIWEALRHASAHNRLRLNVEYIAARDVAETVFSPFDGILLTPGYGKRGTEGMIQAAQIALRKNIPFLGICFGAQLATVAFARERMGWEFANSTEVDPDTPYPVVGLLEDQKGVEKKGGTMRLGGIKIKLLEGTKIREIYGKEEVIERFRHRYHLIPKFIDQMKSEGFIVNSLDREKKIAGFEVKDHRFYLGTQAHPEFRSRPFDPSPPYCAFIKTAKGDSHSKKASSY